MADKVGMPGSDGGASWLRWLADPQRREYGEFLDAQDDRDALAVYQDYRDRIERGEREEE